jgi:DNA-binding transcriptional MerR regulator
MLKEHRIKRLYWQIGRLAAHYGIAESKIRFWEEELKIVVRRDKKGSRIYDAKSILVLHQVYILVECLGLTLLGASRVFNLLQDPQYKDMAWSALETLCKASNKSMPQPPNLEEYASDD